MWQSLQLSARISAQSATLDMAWTSLEAALHIRARQARLSSARPANQQNCALATTSVQNATQIASVSQKLFFVEL